MRSIRDISSCGYVQLRIRSAEERPVYHHALETNTVLKVRLAEVQDKSALKQKRHQYEKDEKRTICQFISA